MAAFALQLLRFAMSLPKRTALATIRFYQKTFSPDHGPLRVLYPHGYCKYSPSCSEYGYNSVERFGVVRGFLLAGWRILRCNPWSAGGHDPVPEKK